MSKLLDIKKLYYSLPYIVTKSYSSYYLFPHKPIAPIEKQNPNFKAQMISYERQLKQYEEKYVMPIKIDILNAAKYSTMKIQKRIKNYNDECSNLLKPLRKSALISWSQVPEQKRKLYQNRVRELKLKNHESIKNIMQNHMIPPSKSYFNAITQFKYYYYRQMNNEVKGMNIVQSHNIILQKYMALSQEKKKQYAKKAKQKNQQVRMNFLHFLQKWNLDNKKLNQIIQVSQSYNRQVRQAEKKLKSNNQIKIDQTL